MKLAREGLPIVAAMGALLVAVVLLASVALGLPARTWIWLAFPLAVLLVFCAWFFRDPDRSPPDDPRVLVSPADGKILRVGAGSVSVFMNVFDVHVCRTPMAGRIVQVEHVPGSFLAAYREDASEQNERTLVVVRAGGHELRVTLVAGLVARRIVSRVRAGDDVSLGQPIAVIRFGSRVDVALPPGWTPEVRRGQRVQAGTTVIARVPASDEARS